MDLKLSNSFIRYTFLLYIRELLTPSDVEFCQWHYRLLIIFFEGGGQHFLYEQKVPANANNKKY